MQSIREINEIISSGLIIEKTKHEMIMPQDKFNQFMLMELNKLALIYSKGKTPFKVTIENEWFLKAVFAYLNRNDNDDLLSYSLEIGSSKISGKLDLDKGLMIQGNYGVGKTLLLRVIQKNLSILKLTGRFVESRTIHETKKEDHVNIIGKDQYGLFIDDLGDEPLKSVDFGNEDTPVAIVLKKRLDNWERLPESPKLFITTNCSNEILVKRYGGRILSRMHSAMNIIILPQKQDFRKS